MNRIKASDPSVSQNRKLIEMISLFWIANSIAKNAIPRAKTSKICIVGDLSYTRKDSYLIDKSYEFTYLRRSAFVTEPKEIADAIRQSPVPIQSALLKAKIPATRPINPINKAAKTAIPMMIFPLAILNSPFKYIDH
jgi:hypothetical protein